MAASLTFDSAYRQIRRGDLAPVYYLTGDEDVLKDELVSFVLQQAVDPASRDFNLDVRSAGDVDGESLHTLVETPPMLAERRVVVIKNLEQWRKNTKVWQVLEQYVANPSPTTVLLLIHGAGEAPNAKLRQHAAHVNLEPLRPERLARWVQRKVKDTGFAIEPDAVDHLVNAVSGDLSQLAMEVEKLAAAAPDDRPLSVQDVSQFVGIRRGETPHDWVSAVLTRDIPQAVGMLERVLAGSGVSAVRLVGMLGTALVGVRLARALLDAGTPPARAEGAVLKEIQRARPHGLGSWKTEARRWTAAAGCWTGGELDRALREAYRADRALKSTTTSADAGTLSDMLLTLGPRKAAA